MLQQRHILRELCPPWLRGEQARSFLNEGIFTIYDIDSDLMFESLMARFPSFCPPDALPYLAKDRHIIVGPTESEAAVRARCLAWMTEAILSGLPIGWLLAMQAYCAPTYPKVRLVTKRSTWYTLEAGAVPRMLRLPGYQPLDPCPYELGPQWPKELVTSQTERLRFSGLYSRYKPEVPNFDWDSLSNPERVGYWWDMVGVIYSHYPFQDDYADLGDTWLLDDPSESVGFAEGYGTFTVGQYIAIKQKSAKSVLRAIVCTNNEALFDPTLPLGSPELPDGYWGRPGKGVAGKIVPSHRLDCRVILGFPKG